MSVKLRLMRMGKKKQPTYRVVAADTRSPRNGRFIEIVGTYQPRLEPSGIAIDNEKALKWLRNGAKPTETVEKLLRISGAWGEYSGDTTVAPAPTAKPAPKPAPAPAAEPEATTPETGDEPAASAPEASEPEPETGDESAATDETDTEDAS